MSNIKVTKIVIDIDGKETELPLESAKVLKEALDAIFPSGIMVVEREPCCSPIGFGRSTPDPILPERPVLTWASQERSFPSA